MNDSRRWIGMAIGVVMLIGASGAEAQDWPQWRGPNRDGKVAGFVAPKAWPKELAAKWTVPVGTGDATPALVGDKLFAFTRQGDEEVISCLNAADGKEVWRDKYAAQPVTGAAARHPGPRSSPTVVDGKVITLGVDGNLSCLNAADGKVLWRKNPYPNQVPKFFTGMSPIVVDGLCIAHLGGPDHGAVIAFELAKGDEKWKWEGDGPAYGSPVLMTVGGAKQIVTQTEKDIVGVATANGKLLWQVASPAQGRFFNSATPIVDGQTVIYTGQGQGTKAVKVEKQGDGFVAKELWSDPELGTAYNTPVLKDGWLYGLSDKGNLFCMNAETGKAAWVDPTKRGGNFAAVLDAGSVLLALPNNSELIAYKPNSAQYEEVAKIKVAPTPTYATPVIAGNRIYVKDQDTLALWVIE